MRPSPGSVQNSDAHSVLFVQAVPIGALPAVPTSGMHEPPQEPGRPAQ